MGDHCDPAVSGWCMSICLSLCLRRHIWVSVNTYSCNTVCWDLHLTYTTCSVSFTDLHGKKQMWLQSPWIIFTGGQGGASDPTTELWNYLLSLVRPHRVQQNQGEWMRNFLKRIDITNSKMTTCCLMTVTAAWRSWIDNVRQWLPVTDERTSLGWRS